MAEIRRDALTDAEIFRSIDVTILDVLLPALPDDADWARAAAVQLVGMVRYASRRDADRTEERIAELAAVLDDLAENDIVASIWSADRSQQAVMAATGAALAAAVSRDDAAADEVRRVLRPVAVRQLDDELASTAPLVAAFRGELDD